MGGPHLMTKAAREKFAKLLTDTAALLMAGELTAIYLGVGSEAESMTFHGFTSVRAMDELGTMVAADAADQGWAPPWEQ